ncbi:MAG: T9SS type A sorting domain-containing protein [Cyclobacteriaceae bacterium]|nr:T9SS type A sorting domain-containing protein [Cyclobacteriaceae bacterium]
MNKLLADRSFARKTAARYFSLRETTLSEASIYGYIDSVATVLDGAQKRHYSKWRILGQNVGTPEVDAQPNSYAGEVMKFKNWIGTRLRWLDTNIGEFIVTAADEALSSSELIIYPNPASEYVNIQSDEGLRQIDFISSHGYSVISHRIKHGENMLLSVASLSPGIYFIKLTFEDGRQQMEKLIKQ